MNLAAVGLEGFPSDLPPPYYGFALLSYWVSGVCSILLGLGMAGIFTARRRLVAVHTLPLFGGLVIYFLSSGVAQICRGMVLGHALEHDGIVHFDPAQQVRAVCVIIRAIAAVWCLASLMQAIPYMRRYRSPEYLQQMIDDLESRRGSAP